MNNSSFENLLDIFSRAGKYPELVAEFHLLNSENKKTRQEAEEELFRRSYHQGDIGVVAPFVIPFFIDRLDREMNLRILESLLIELGCLASGSSRNINLENCEEEYTEEEKIQITEALALFAETQSALSDGVARYFYLLNHDSVFIRNSTIYLLMYCQFQLENIVQIFYSTFQLENHEDIKSLIVFGLVILSDRNCLEIDTVFLSDILISSATDSVKLSAAIALAHVEEENISGIAFARLLELSKKDGLWEHIRVHESALPFHILHFVDRLNDEQTFQLVEAMMQGWGLDDSVDDLILLVFKCDDDDDFWQEREIDSISKLQLSFLQKVASTDNVSYSSTLGNLLMTFGLRGDDEQNREKLIELLNR
ncbi:hypothetical protein [Chamaesiphon sp.]|uniref:hypothetical protein n=1 Tax=Chamaesiphon sp. TaxID=2814140 RepID=UPI00359456A9